MGFGVWLVVLVGEGVGVGVAGGTPQFCSMQYEFPTVRLQAAAWLGFCFIN